MDSTFPVTGSWFKDRYEGLERRYYTTRLALNLISQRKRLSLGSYGLLIVETGTTRLDDMLGAGNSTVVLADFISRVPNGHLITIDNNKEHLDRAKNILDKRFGPLDCVEYTHKDSVKALKYLSGEFYDIDLLYLDSLDCPIVEMWRRYGVLDNPIAADQVFSSIPEEELAKDNWDLLSECQEHCLNELRAALPTLGRESVVMIDDAGLPGGGKARLAKEELRLLGFRCLLDEYQTVWELAE
jgi:hypothetical protein